MGVILDTFSGPVAASCAMAPSDAWSVERALVDRSLHGFLPGPPRCPESLAAAMRYAVFPGGKRLRPVLTLLTARACGSSTQPAIAPACAVELVHCYSLVHDDLPAMDDDDLRRGRPTVHKAFDQATALLAGDALLTLAFELIASHVRDGSIAAECIAELAAASGPTGMVGGQMDDWLGASAVETDSQLARLESIHRRKTGALISAAIRMGAIVAGAAPAARSALDRFSSNVGLAFQIIDDLLDLYGDEAKIGKRARKDDAKGKLTFPGLLGDVEAARRANLLVDEACTALDRLGSDAEPLQSLARFVVKREY